MISHHPSFSTLIDQPVFHHEPLDSLELSEIVRYPYQARLHPLRGENVDFLGPPGVVKTHLAIALGINAVEAGHRVLFLTLDELLTGPKPDCSSVWSPGVMNEPA